MRAKNSKLNDHALPGRCADAPDAHGQAAILLLESLIHGLVDRNVLSTADAVEIVGVAAEVKTEVAEEMGDTPTSMDRSLSILRLISVSLKSDLAN